MEPVTHILTGACLARTGLNRKAAYATLAMAVAAEFPDIDTLWGLRGPVASFEHHRGITHTFVGLPFEAALIVAAIYGVHRYRSARATNRTAAAPAAGDDHFRVTRPLTTAPVRWGLLYLFTLLALLSHLLLDYTNNYGIRPFFPFNPRWYAASITFIFDPLMFAMLALALLLPAIFSLVSREQSSRRQPFRGQGLAIAALLGVVALWGLRETQHERALQLALAQNAAEPVAAPATPPDAADDSTGVAPASPTPIYLPALQALASPDILNPFRWYTVADFGPFYQLAEADTRDRSLDNSGVDYAKPQRSPAVLAAFATPLGRAYLDWSPMPFVTEVPSGEKGITTVLFQDPRFMQGFAPFLDKGRTPLTGAVEVDAQGSVVSESMDSPTLPPSHTRF